MAEKILMIALSPTMDEGTISTWTKKVGDVIKTGDVICEVETDKATMDYESAQEGTLLKIIIDQGKQAKVGDLIAIIGKPGEDISSLEGAAPIKAPPLSPSTVATESKAPQQVVGTEVGKSGSTDTVKSSPLARKIAETKGIDITTIQGSGPNGRVIKRDLENVNVQASPSQKAVAKTSVGDKKVPVAGKRAVIAKRLAESLFTAPHFFLKKSVIADGLMGARTMLNKEVHGNAKVSFNAFIIKLVAEALKKHPSINASWQGDHILEFGSIDIGLAVDLGNGLITPIVRDVANKGIVQIDAELKALIDKAASNSLRPEEYSGATFTISNLGSFGVEEFTAIINPPGSAILALGEVAKTPIVNEDGSLGVASVMKLTLSCDHRVIDGALGARFIAELANLIENPVRALF